MANVQARDQAVKDSDREHRDLEGTTQEEARFASAQDVAKEAPSSRASESTITNDGEMALAMPGT